MELEKRYLPFSSVAITASFMLSKMVFMSRVCFLSLATVRANLASASLCLVVSLKTTTPAFTTFPPSPKIGRAVALT